MKVNEIKMNISQFNWTLVGNLLIVISYGWGIGMVIFGKYKPDLISRGGWMTMSLVNAALLHKSGTNKAVVLCGLVMALGSIVLFLLSKRIAHDHGSLNIYKCAILGTGFASICYLYTQSPIATVLSVLCTDFLIGLPTLRGVWRRGSTENGFYWLSFLLGFVILALTSRGDVLGSVFSIYFAAYGCLIMGVKYRSRLSGLPARLGIG